jgi:hypothetical protein
VNDCLTRPIDKNELLERARSQVRERRYTERLRDNVQISIEMAITDALTGLFNRRYMESHLTSLLEQAGARGKPLTVLVLDIDYFKSINDSHGHDVGNDVLREFALRISARSAASSWPAATAARSSWRSCPRPTWRSPPWWRSGCAGASPPSRSLREQHYGHDLDRHRRSARRRRQRRRRPQACRSGALSRQARQAKPGSPRRCLIPGGSGPSSSGLAADARPNWHYG